MRELDPLLYILPAVVVAVLAFYFFKTFFDEQEKNRRHLLVKDLQKEVTPIRLQSYERLILLLERIHLPKLLDRITYDELSKEQYRDMLVETISKEFEYNLSQQVYVTTDCWKIINVAQYTNIKIIQSICADPEVKSPQEMKIELLKNSIDNELPTTTAISYVKEEVQQMWKS